VSTSRQLVSTSHRAGTEVFAPIQREFNRLFDDLGGAWASLRPFDLEPRMDVRETRQKYEVTVELPGISQDDVRIDLSDHMLTVSGEKKSEKETQDDHFRMSERSYGAFSRSVRLPLSAEAGQIKATMTDGVLKIVAPKQAGAEATAIKIQSAK
jgi:HSP20 family protein